MLKWIIIGIAILVIIILLVALFMLGIYAVYSAKQYMDDDHWIGLLTNPFSFIYFLFKELYKYLFTNKQIYDIMYS